MQEGFVFSEDTPVTEYYSVPEPGLNYPDVTKPDTTHRFLHITHDAYKLAAGDEFESLFSAVFTDHEKPRIRTGCKRILRDQFLWQVKIIIFCFQAFAVTV